MNLWTILLFLVMTGACNQPSPKINVPVVKSLKLDSGIVIMELFTSQGCSSCPPADAIMEKLSKKYPASNYIFLAYHVDYWDYLGWVDVFGSHEYSLRQQEYVQKLKGSGVYTPQVFINASSEFIGGRAKEIESSIKKFAAHSSIESMSYFIHFGKIFINRLPDINKAELKNNLELLEIKSISDSTVSVKRGENKGKVIHYSHIVSRINRIPWDKISVGIPIATLDTSKETILLLQDKQSKKIYAAVQVSGY